MRLRIFANDELMPNLHIRFMVWHMVNPFFSVVIPLYNKQDYIERAIESVLSQRFKDLELIVVDDGSTDDGAAKVELIHDARIRLIKQMNQGEGPARNSGIVEAIGDWVAFLDADDMWLPSHLECLKKVIDRFSDVGLVSSRSIEIHGSTIPSEHACAIDCKPRKIDYFSAAAKKIGVINSSSVAISKSVFECVGGFKNYRMGCDLEFWARVALLYPVAIIGSKTSVYFRGTGGVMDTQGASSKPMAKQPLSSLSEISPSLAMLSSRLNDIPEGSKLRRSVINYINSRLRQAIRGAFIRGDLYRVKSLRALYMSPIGAWRNRLWWLLAALPLFLLSAASRLRLRSKDLYLAFRR